MDFYEKGKTISFRLPQNTPKSVIEHLNKRKITLGRNFSREIAPLFVKAIEESLEKSGEKTISIPLPPDLTTDQMNWLNSSYTKSLLSQLIYHVVNKQGSPFVFGEDVQQIDNRQSEKVQEVKTTFKVNSTTGSFIQKNFLDFDDDDD
ncbi:hypothetical protein SFC55_25260 [Niallia taxi]|uniref:hypothetical protein n=1 Tax=Niallia taxi TaxID=2499688 RepID=UPI0039821723